MLQRLGSYLLHLVHLGTKMLKSVNFCVLIQFILHYISYPSDAVGSSLQLDLKASLKLHSARSSLETCSLPVLQGGLISHQPRAWQEARAGGSHVHGQRQKVTITHSGNNCLPQTSLQTLPVCQIKQALERERERERKVFLFLEIQL